MRRWTLLIVLLLLSSCISQEFRLANVAFCTCEPGKRECDRQPHATYRQGEIIWMYTECYKFRYIKDSEEYMSEFDITIEIFDDHGTNVRTITESFETPLDAEPDFVWFKLPVKSEGLERGKYTVLITLVDKYSGNIATKEAVFYIE
ncbi:MAG: hypothetical protein HXS41_01600 [Theionarchaea archaeon]|nr:hypothetical protein [Theionarchaea archaeon]MBU7001504.1 hypothetical protein [Theionarchaea archaeon]MBU7019723.1 hypothetical protein [Theionarchaea archaeon]MBU7034434.1 hypothetical protein [Theionarchaea archaeon]MBU7040645.1 hypothetical protein [Theionarchaea archaeon]